VNFQRADGSVLPEDESELSKVREDGHAVQVADDTITRKDGTTFPVAYSAAPLFSGTPVRGLVVVFRATTEEKAERARTQRELNALTCSAGFAMRSTRTGWSCTRSRSSRSTGASQGSSCCCGWSADGAR
jgi:hypothetical protein